MGPIWLSKRWCLIIKWENSVSFLWFISGLVRPLKDMLYLDWWRHLTLETYSGNNHYCYSNNKINNNNIKLTCSTTGFNHIHVNISNEWALFIENKFFQSHFFVTFLSHFFCNRRTPLVIELKNQQLPVQHQQQLHSTRSHTHVRQKKSTLLSFSRQAALDPSSHQQLKWRKQVWLSVHFFYYNRRSGVGDDVLPACK